MNAIPDARYAGLPVDDEYRAMKDSGHAYHTPVITINRELGDISENNDAGDYIGKRMIATTNCSSELTACVDCSQAPLHFGRGSLCFWG
jgi:hypothetical protein